MGRYWVVENNMLDQTTQDIINEYLLSLKLANRSEETIRSYRGYLERTLLDLSRPLDELTSEHILDYISVRYANLKKSTLKSYITNLSVFFKFCLEEGYIDKILVKNRWKPRPPSPIPKYLDATELAKVKLEAEKMSLRDRTIFYFLLSSGARVGEVYKLNKDDIDLENRKAKVLGKGNKVRDVHFSETCAILLERYIENHPKEVEALFIDANNERLPKYKIQSMIRSLGEKSKINKRISPHSMRHTFSTLLLSKGTPIEFIADELGHSDINTTRIYARLPLEELVNLYGRYMG